MIEIATGRYNSCRSGDGEEGSAMLASEVFNPWRTPWHGFCDRPAFFVVCPGRQASWYTGSDWPYVQSVTVDVDLL